MLFMNEWEIDEAVQRARNHPVLSAATTFLMQLRDETNAHSDGWHSWPAPCRAAKKLIELIKAGNPTERDFQKAIVPIRAFYTRRGAAAGMCWPVGGPRR
jgi:nicotinamidase-related amidase